MRFSRIVATIGACSLVGSLLAAAQLQGSPALAQEPVTVFSSDFEDGTTQGWFGRGPAEVAVSDAEANTGESSLLTTNRDDTWQGPGREMGDVLQPGVTYDIEAFVRLADAAETDVHLTVQRTPVGEDSEFERVASDVTVTDDAWTRVAGSYSFSTEENEELQLYLESPDATASFYLDDVTITTSDLPEDVLVASDFEDGTTQGWGPRGDEQVAATQDDSRTGDWSLLTSERTEPWNGPALTITPHVEPGQTYGFSLHLKLAPGSDPQAMQLSVQTDADGSSSFDTLAQASQVTADEWVELSATWTPGSAADAFHVYAETADADALADFYLDDFVMTGIAPPDIEDIPSLHEVLADHFPLGAAIDSRETAGASADLLTRHFNSITAENHMKPEAVQPEEGEFTFAAGDELVEFAEANDMRVYGHVLVWHSQTPDWFFEDENGEPLSGDNPAHRDLLLDRMETHINAVADQYGDRLWAWDVVNEAIDESQEDGLRRSPWYNIIGPEYLDHAFHFAREAFGPDVQLFINDFNTEFPSKRQAYFDVVSGMLDRGVPIDGVGHQLHLNLIMPVSNVHDTIERFRDLPVDQAVTELDVAIQESATEDHPAPPPDRVVRQGFYYQDLFEVLRAHDDVLVSVTAWGLHDGRSWLRFRATPRPWEAPLFFDDQLQSKPAYWGVVDPDQLPHFPQARNVAAGTPAAVDGERELLWDLLPGTRVGADEGTTFQLRWDEDNLYLLVEVADGNPDAGDQVELYVDDANAKAGEYTDGDAHYTVGRDGTVTGDTTAAVAETDEGYRVEAALPLLTPGAMDRQVGFDLRITDGATGNQLSWSDQSHEQDTDTSRWGTLTFIEEVTHVDVPFATTSPEIDGAIDEIWATAPAVRTEVLVEGDPDGAKADVRLLWDEDRLYVLAEVTDPELDAANSNPWEQDSIEIFVNPHNTKAGPYGADDGQYRINFENHQTLNGNLEVIGELTSAAAVVDGGYLIEASVELSTMEPEVGSFLGLELQVNDATSGARTAVHTWHDPTGQSFQNTSRWGVAQLVAADDPEPSCDDTVEGNHFGPLTADSGTLCLADGARVFGPVTVRPGASLVATGAEMTGPLSSNGADTVRLQHSKVTGPVSIVGTTGQVELVGNQVTGPVSVVANSTEDTPIVVSDNTVRGPLSCTGNSPAPVDHGVSNTVFGPKSGQCNQL